MELSHVGREKRKIDMLTFTVSLHTRIWRCLKAAPPPPISTLRSRKIGARKKLMDQGNQTPRAKLRSGQDFRLACPKRQIRPLDFGCWIGSQIGPFGFWTLPFGSYKFCTSPGFRIKDTRPRQLGSVDTYVQILPVEFDDGHAESKPASQYMIHDASNRCPGHCKIPSTASDAWWDDLHSNFPAFSYHPMRGQISQTSSSDVEVLEVICKARPFSWTILEPVTWTKNIFYGWKMDIVKKVEWGVCQKIISHWCLKIRKSG